MYKIRLCPFCGGKPYLEDSHRAFIGGQTTRVAYVRCKQCNARSPRFKLEDYGCSSWSGDANKAAVEAWNNRSGSNDFIVLKTREDYRYHKRKEDDSNCQIIP